MGWQIYISALKILWKSLDSQHNCRFLLTSRLNQDCLENHFSLIRSRGWFRHNPDTIQLNAAFKQVVVKNLLVPPKTGNCENDLGGFVIDFDHLSRCSVTKFSAKQTVAKYGWWLSMFLLRQTMLSVLVLCHLHLMIPFCVMKCR